LERGKFSLQSKRESEIVKRESEIVNRVLRFAGVRETPNTINGHSSPQITKIQIADAISRFTIHDFRFPIYD
jgi:hypothetical protein